MKKLFLLDGHALVYRAHYAFANRPLINSKGMNVSAANGFVRTLWEVLQKEKPSHIAVSFDLPGPTFRHVMYEPYKANRDAQPEDISAMLPYIMRIIAAMNIPIATKEGYEADDVIGTLAKQAEREGFDVYMMTPDKDFGQLVSDKVFLYKPARSGDDVEVWGVKEVLDRWQIKHIDQVVDMLGLQGDSVDNIPGIPGIGPKSAAVLLEQFGSVENIIANADKLKGKQQENVRQYAEQGLLSKTLARIDIEVPITFNDEEYAVSEVNYDALAAVFKELEFKTLANTILGASKPQEVPANQQYDLFGNPIAAAKSPSVSASANSEESAPAAHSVADKNIHNTPHEYHLAADAASRATLIAALSASTIFCFDTETTNIDPNEAELVGMSFSVKAHEAWYVPVPAQKAEAQAILAEFKTIFENANIDKIGQNIKYDIIILKCNGIELQGNIHDTMIMHYILEPDMRHGMDFLAETYLKYQPIPIEDLIGKKGKNQLSMRDVPIEKVKDYAAEDADITFQLHEVLQAKLEEPSQQNLYQTMEIPLVRIIADMEYEGIKVDAAYLESYSKELDIRIQEVENSIYTQAGLRFNIASPKQVGEVLFEKLKIPYRWKKTSKSDQYSTDEDKLAELAPNHPIISTILEFRGLAKLQSTYVDALPRMLNSKTQRVHSSFNQALAATGRLSSNNPNLQNIPIKTAEGRRVREAFVPRDADFMLLSADYSQIELRLIAEISNEEAMLSAFQAGLDIHQATAAKVYDTPLETVTSDQRRNAKTVNFSIIYGAGSLNVSQQLGIPRTEAKVLIDNYFREYAGLKNYMDSVVENARQDGYVTTLMGRRRYLRDIDSRNQLARSNAERMAVNSPVQGSAADMIKMAMIHIHQALKAGNYRSRMILQVHDELVFDVYKPELEAIKTIVENGMKNAIPNLQVPILVGIGTGDNWLEAH